LNLHLSRMTFLVLVFTVLSAASAVYIISSTWNYLHFYPSLDQLQPRISQVTFSGPSSTNQSTLQVKVVLENPQGYSGITVVMVYTQLYFNTSSTSLFQDRPLINTQFTRIPLGGDDATSFLVGYALGQNDTSTVKTFLNANAGHVTAHAIFSVKLSSFLDAASGPISLSREANGSL
jgi:hypothetical protein